MVFIADTILENIVLICKKKGERLSIKQLMWIYLNVGLMDGFSFFLCDNLYLVIFKQKSVSNVMLSSLQITMCIQFI